MQRSLAEQTRDAKIINLAGRQRMLSQRLTKAVLLMPQQAHRRAEVVADLDLWVTHRRRLLHGDMKAFGAASPDIASELEASAQRLEIALRACIADRRVTPAHREALLAAEAAYLPRIDRAVHAFTREAEAAVHHVRKLEGALLAVLLVVLLLEALLIFRPLVQRAAQHLHDKDQLLAQTQRDARYVRAVTSVAFGVWDWNHRDAVVTWSPELRTMVGLAHEVEPSWELLLERFDANSRAFVRQRLDDMAKAGGTLATDVQVMGADGARWFRLEGRAFDDVHVAGVLMDIDQQKRVADERERMLRANDDKLQQARRGLAQAGVVSSLHSLAAGLAHDFNNLLQVIRVSADELKKTGAQADAVADIQAAVASGARLAGLLLALKPGSSSDGFQPVDVVQLVDSSRRMLERVVSSRISLDFELPAEPSCVILGDEGQLRQALLNLVVNARDAIEANGRIRIAVRSVRDGVEIAVDDDGIGMPDEIRQRVLEPFFTTKSAGRGSGLGLAMVHGTVIGHQGVLSIESAEGHGTTIRMWMPDFRAAPQESRPSAVLPERLTVLVVDDDRHVLASTKRMLKRWGYQVVGALGGEAALEEVKAAAAIDAVVCDVMMPGLDGMATVERVRAILGATTPVVMISGYSDKPIGVERPVAFLRKPFGADELEETLGRLLASRGGGRATDGDASAV